MAESPSLYLATTIDLDRAAGWLANTNAERVPPERLVMAVLLLKSVARALRDVPELNGRLVDCRIHPNAAVHLGVVVARREGPPVVPVLRDAERRSLGDLMGSLRELVRRARRDRLREMDLGEPTFTVTNRRARRAGRVPVDRSTAGRGRRVRQGPRAAVRGGWSDRL